MLDWTEYAKICLALLVIVNPVGAVPLFASMTAGNSEQEKKQIARVASTSVGVVLIVLIFKSSDALTAAYGIAVTGTMFISTCMIAVLIKRVWNWPVAAVAAFMFMFLCIDGAYFASNLTKVPDGGWFPLLVAVIVFGVISTATARYDRAQNRVTVS